MSSERAVTDAAAQPAAPASSAAPGSHRRPRVDAVDALRGLVMVFMCLDHTREYFGNLGDNPENLETTTPILFFTRWITHYCAPTFVFLAGLAAWLYGRKVEDKLRLSQFLFTRGLWLVFLEFTVVYFGWAFSLRTLPLMFIVIAVIGTSMMVLSLLIWLPYRLLLVPGLGIVCLHNLLDSIHPDDCGSLSMLWIFLHEGGMLYGESVVVGYPLLAWVGVITAGYCFGPVMELPRARRRRLCAAIGGGCTLAFLLLRYLDLYGDPSGRIYTSSATINVLSFLRCTKYPPSLLYLLMTLGPALIMLAIMDRDSAADPPAVWSPRSVLLTFGRVPLFYYVVHLYLIHSSAMLTYRIYCGKWISPLVDFSTAMIAGESMPPEYGFSLPIVYLAWLCMLLILWPLCAWYGRFKRGRRHVIWSYL